jgi:hypothetical protein
LNVFKTHLVTDGATALPARRWHRALTIPALAITFIALVANRYLLVSVLVFPPLVAMPWLLRAAARPTERAVGRAHQAVRATGHIMCALAFVLLVIGLGEGAGGAAFALSAIELTAASLLLLAAGKHAREARLGGCVTMIASLQFVALLPLAWLGTGFSLLAPTALAMFVGGLWWFFEAETVPVVENKLPVAIAL